MTTSNLAGRLAYFQETTSGTGPADWNASGTLIRYLAGSLDPSSLVQTVIEDERSQTYVLDDDPVIQGIKGSVEFSHEMYLHGHGQSPGDGSAPTALALSTLLEHCLGVETLVTSDALVALGAHTTTAIELTDTLAVGDWVGLLDSDSNIHTRRVTSTAAGGVGVIHQLHRALPFTPADSDIAYGCIVLDIDEDILEDSAAGPYTLSWLIEKGRGSQRQTWECYGCKSYLSSISLGRDQAAKIGIGTMVGSFDLPPDAAVPTWTGSPAGAAGRAIGPLTEVFIQTQSTTTENSLNCTSFEVEPGVMPARIESVTEQTSGLPGTALYGLARNPCNITATIVPHVDTYYTNFDAGTVMHCQFERQAAVGSAWSIYFPDCTVQATPTLADASSALGHTISLRAHADASQSTDHARSRMQIVLC